MNFGGLYKGFWDFFRPEFIVHKQARGIYYFFFAKRKIQRKPAVFLCPKNFQKKILSVSKRNRSEDNFIRCAEDVAPYDNEKGDEKCGAFFLRKRIFLVFEICRWQIPMFYLAIKIK